MESVLADQVAPIFRRVIDRNFGATPGAAGRRGAAREDVEDLYGEAVQRLIAALRRHQRRSEQERAAGRADPAAIRDLPRYAATLARNHCSQLLRERYPLRRSLTDCLYRLLEKRPEFARWRGSYGEDLAGLAAWSGQEARRGDAYDRLIEDPIRFLQRPGGTTGRERLTALCELLSDVFRHTGGPVEFDDLLAVVAAVTGVDRRWGRVERSTDDAGFPDPPSPERGPALTVIERDGLRRLWKGIAGLKPAWRAALLLNLRDPGDIRLFHTTGTATPAEIARAIGMTPEELASACQELPWEDERIAARLGVSVQQVRNFRMEARKRLRQIDEAS